MIPFYKAEVKSTNFSKTPLISVEILGKEFKCKPYELKDIKFPKKGDKVLVFSLTPPFNERLYYVPLDLDEDSKNFNVQNLESIYSKATNILSNFLSGKSDIKSNNKSFLIMDENGSILLIANKDGSRLFLMNDGEVILASKNNVYIKLNSNKVDLLNNQSYLSLKDKILLQKGNNNLISIEEEEITIGSPTSNFIKIKNDYIFLGNSNTSLVIDSSGVIAKGPSGIIEITSHNHISGAPGINTGPPQNMSAVSPPSVSNPNADTIPNDYSV